MNIPRQRRYPMRPIPPRTTYNITINETKTTPAKVAAAVAEAMKRYDRRRG